MPFSAVLGYRKLLQQDFDLGPDVDRSCSVGAFKERESGKAKNLLLQAIERYFQGGIVDVEARIHQTDLPPIYLQHPGRADADALSP